jgi:nucleotide-binding universal stress UspA family protein
MIAINRILCPTDFSELSRSALAQAVAIARWQDAEITLLYVAPPIIVSAEAYVLPPALSAEARERLRGELRAFAESARDEDVRIGIELQEGTPSAVILEGAQGFDLVVMGTQGRHGLDGWLLGSVTETVLRHAPCPVLTIAPRSRPASPAHFDTILCPVDFSPRSEHTAQEAGRLAAETGAHLVLLHVVERPGAAMAASPFGGEDTREDVEENARRRLRRLRQPGAGDSVEEMVLWGHPDREIVRLARDWPIGLIVMGAQGGALDSPVFGSTAHKVVRAAPCPVLVVPAHSRALADVEPEPVSVGELA